MIDYCMGSTLWKETEEDDRLLATAIGSYTIFPRRKKERT